MQPKTILVLGDLMLDLYTFGRVHRISPEAPVPILCAEREQSLPGGAGNVVLNLLSLGMHVKVLSRLGEDHASTQLWEILKAEGANCSAIHIDPTYTLPRKHRLVAQQQQLLRIDHEDNLPLRPSIEAAIVDQLPKTLEGVDFIAVSDYGKGFLTPSLLHHVFMMAKVPILVDPKGRDFSRYRGATYLKPNQEEALAAAGLTFGDSLDQAAKIILQQVPLEALIVTRSEEGIALFRADTPRVDYPTTMQSVRDVTGAGDTVLAVMAAGLANLWSLDRALQVANQAAAIAISQVGCARVSWLELQEAMHEQSSYPS